MIVSVILGIAIVVIGYFVWILFDRTKPNTDTEYPFSEYMDLIELPVLVLTNNGKKLRFIIDSGSNGCHINKAVISELELDDVSVNDKKSETATGGGMISSPNERCTMKLHLDNVVFTVPFSVTDMSPQFDFIKKSEGVQLHGILGSNFLSANNWVLDFAKNIAYMKK